MHEAKPFASLSSGLLARKGQAKPAMRPQPYTTMGQSHDDLGWNDMGHPAQRQSVVTPGDVAPQVVIQQAEIARKLEAEVERPVAAEAPVKPPRAEVVPIARGKAAFTLRLDPKRHLRLRLACAIDHRSAQQIVTQALDSFLDSLPEIEELAGRIPASRKR